MKKILSLVLILLLFQALPAAAVETVKSPLMREGVFQLEQKGKFQHDSNPKRDDQKEYDFALAYGLTQYWKTKVETEFEQKRREEVHYKNINWENIVALTGNDSMIPTAFYLNLLVSDRSDSRHAATAGIIVMKEIGPTVSTANLFYKHEFGDRASNKASLIYRLQSRYRLYSFLEPGFELWGDTNKHDAFEDQVLKIGPGIFGKFSVGNVQGFSYELVYLLGATPASHDGTFKWRLVYDF